MVNILFVRHGETDSNKNKMIMGHSDIRLNSKGKNQATICGAYIAKKFPNISKVYCSTLLRAKETIEIIKKQFNGSFPNIEYDIELSERSFGDFEGNPVNEVFSKLVDEEGNYDNSIQPPKGESGLQFYDRCSLAINKILDYSKANKDETIMVLTHGGTMRHILGYLLLSKDNKYNNFPVNCKNCSLTLLNIDEESKQVIDIKLLNYFQYLD